jgi:hypothetical protein
MLDALEFFTTEDELIRHTGDLPTKKEVIEQLDKTMAELPLRDKWRTFSLLDF